MARKISKKQNKRQKKKCRRSEIRKGEKRRVESGIFKCGRKQRQEFLEGTGGVECSGDGGDLGE